MRLLRTCLVLVALTTPAVAFPCGNSMEFDRPPENPGDRALRMARRSLTRKDFNGALAEADKALKGGREKDARRIIGLARLGLKQYDQAIPVLGQSHKEFGNDPYLSSKLGEAEVGAGKFAEGQARLEELAKGDLIPDAEGWLALARARHKAGDNPGALAAVGRSLELKPSEEAEALKKELSGAAVKPPEAKEPPKDKVGS